MDTQMDQPAAACYSRTMKTTDTAWAAGLFDGEGCVWTRWPKRNNLVALEMRMTHEGTMRRWHRMFGGRLVSACLSGASVRPQWKWTVETNAAIGVLKALLPYLVTKRRVALAALAMARTQNNSRLLTLATRRRRDQLAGEIRAANS